MSAYTTKVLVNGYQIGSGRNLKEGTLELADFFYDKILRQQKGKEENFVTDKGEFVYKGKIVYKGDPIESRKVFRELIMKLAIRSSYAFTMEDDKKVMYTCKIVD